MNYGEMLDWHRRHQRRHHHRHHPGARPRRPAGSACWRSTRITASRLRGEAAARQSQPVAFRPRHGERLDGHLRLQYRRLLRALHRGRAGSESSHDFGKDVIPRMLGAVPRHRLRLPRHQRQAASLLARRRHARRLLRGQHGPGDVDPEFNLYDQRWPIRTKCHAAAAGQVRVRAGGPPHGRGGRFDGERAAASSRADACCTACFRRACASTVTVKWSIRS